jgi:hypothetical protein
VQQLAECQPAPGNNNTSSCFSFKPPSVVLHQEFLEQVQPLVLQ